jgi:peroxiredoxin
MRPPRHAPWLSLALVALALALVLVVLLSRQVTTLRARDALLREHATFLYPGYLLPAVTARALDGSEVEIGRAPAGGRQVLAIFTTTCPHCLATLPAWNRLADLARPDSTLQVIGVSLDGGDTLTQYLGAHPLRFPVLALRDTTIRFLYRMRSVPQTVILDARGMVLHLRRGRLEGPAVVDSLLEIARSRRGSLPADSGSELEGEGT